MEVTVHSYRNPTGRCDGCQDGPDPGCCDETDVRPANEACPVDSLIGCDTLLGACIRPIGSDCDFTFANFIGFNTNSYDFDSELGTDNPSWTVERDEPWNVSLVYIR